MNVGLLLGGGYLICDVEPVLEQGEVGYAPGGVGG